MVILKLLGTLHSFYKEITIYLRDNHSYSEPIHKLIDFKKGSNFI